MSEEQVNETVEETPEAPEAPEAASVEAPAEEKKEGISLKDLKVGYVVGLTDEGNFVFELVGTDPGLVELLGVNAHAAERVRQIYARTQMTGDALTTEVGKGLAIINQKIDQLLGVIAPKKPDNKL
jgi:hypothetical protein